MNSADKILVLILIASLTTVITSLVTLPSNEEVDCDEKETVIVSDGINTVPYTMCPEITEQKG